MRILLTAFAPFGGRRRNTSADLLRAIRPRQFLCGGLPSCKKILLPVDFETTWPRLETHLLKWQPDLVIMTGEGKHSYATLETVAHNMRRCAYGKQPIEHNGPALLPSFFAQKLSVRLQHHADLAVDSCAGDYLCNFTYFQHLKNYPTRPAIFLHVRPLDESCEQTDFGRIRAVTEEVITTATALWQSIYHKSN